MDQDTPPKAPRPGARRWVKIVLAVSLTLNLAVIGLIAGAGVKHWRDDDHRRPVRSDVTSFGPYTRALPEEARARMRAAYRDKSGDLGRARKDLRQDFESLRAALEAVPYDEAAVVAIMDRQRGRIDTQVLVVRRLFLDEVAAMSDDERAALARNLKKVLRRGPPRGDHK